MRPWLITVNDAPHRMLSRELHLWLGETDLDADVEFVAVEGRNVECQYNTAIESALIRGHENLVFIDSDVRPADLSDFWTCPTDVVGAAYNLHLDTDDSIHFGFWRTTRPVLLATGPPWIEWEYDAKHTRATDCLCRTFCRKALAAGFTVK